jgi:hypothetical protein
LRDDDDGAEMTYVKCPVLRLERDVSELRLCAHPVEAGDERRKVTRELKVDLVERRVILDFHAAHTLQVLATSPLKKIDKIYNLITISGARPTSPLLRMSKTAKIEEVLVKKLNQ